ncbi:MAG: flagellar basal body L-ring protein FlgH [Epsilonproteobacteria bacterium]|nr:flagellar basal body L-ring protein FlgH [Campylobacterota bacterium]
MKFGVVFCLSVFIVSFFSGCTAKSADPTIAMKPPVYVEQLPSKEKGDSIQNEGSLFGKGDNPLFSDRKAMNVNDLVTVVIDESIFQSSSAKKSLSKNTNDNLGGGLFTSTGSNGIVNNAVSKLNGFANIGFQTNSQNTFSSKGDNSRNEMFTTTISARVIKILNNGNYFIEGSREMLINGEKQIVQISGVIRPYDIDQTNTISSKYIADAKILYKTEGEIDQNSKKGWGTRLVETIWPF